MKLPNRAQIRKNMTLKIRNHIVSKSYVYALRDRSRMLTECFFFQSQSNRRKRERIYRCLYPIGETSHLGIGCRFHRPHAMQRTDLVIGENVWIGAGVNIDYTGGVTIENNVSISDHAILYSHNHTVNAKQNWICRNGNKNELCSLTIRYGAWIGTRALILPRTRYIGKNAIVAAGSVVRNDVPDNAIVSGNPARITGYRS